VSHNIWLVQNYSKYHLKNRQNKSLNSL